MPIITINGRIPSKKNSKRPFIRGGRVMMFPSSNYVTWHKNASQQLKQYTKKITGSHIELLFYFPDNRKTDLTNKAESIMDTLVDNGFLEDDNCTIVNSLYLKYMGVDKVNPRCEIIW